MSRLIPANIAQYRFLTMEALLNFWADFKTPLIETWRSVDNSLLGADSPLLLHPQSEADSPRHQRDSEDGRSYTEESDEERQSEAEPSRDQTQFTDRGTNTEESDGTPHYQTDPSHSGLSEWEEEAARQSVMLVFEEEIQDAYTDGPGCLIEAHDGVKPCIALTISSDLSAKIQKMVISKRNFEAEKVRAKARSEAVKKFSSELRTAKVKHQSRIASEEARQSVPDEEKSDKISSLRQELEMLELLSENMTAVKTNIELNLSARADGLAAAQAAVSAYLEDAFVYAQLSEPDAGASPEPVPEYDLQEEYQTLRDQMEEINGGPPARQTLDTSDDHLRANKPVQTPAQEAMLQASTDLWHARERLQQAQNRFHARDEIRRDEYQQNIELEEAGQPTLDVSNEAFDCRWVKCITDMTRELIEAEDAVEQAKIAAREAGLPCEDDRQSSCFADDADDGPDGPFRSGDPDTSEHVAAEPRVLDWFDSLVEAGDAEFMGAAEVDDWDYSEAGMSDSLSMVAQGSDRRRIDKWQQVCRT
ncbi:unnamed protein product [Zymoseptoria tritici ST99CH_1E4]|uniref:Uncharacterized protein n=1 Tax=Zymoseptoria tritici ST99CH_1E4 TaxID=1276532 RepID=A0A2H1GCB1_ZYMTR|nr:unnamed protein product [Zymoseptoria tritici ST99CH_1E4]